MRADNPDFNFGYKPLPEGLLGPTARKKRRRPSHLILLAVLALHAAAVGAVVTWSHLGEADDLRVLKHDPIEDDPNKKHTLDAADREAQQVIAATHQSSSGNWVTVIGCGRSRRAFSV